MNNAGLASLFSSTGTGNPTLDAALGIQPVTDGELAAYQAQLAAFAQQDTVQPISEPQFQAQPQSFPQGEVVGVSPNASAAYQFFLNKGLQPHQAAAVVGNLMQESGASLPTNITNSIGAHGIAQWLGGRKAALLNRPDPDSLNTQLNFIWDELNTTEKKAFGKLLQTQTPEEASYAVRKFYERPGEHEANDPRRVKNTYNILQGARAPSAPASAPTPPTAQHQETMELPPDMQRVWLSDGQELYAPKELGVPQIAESLKAQGVDAVPLRDFTTPAGQVINVPYDMPDNVAMAHLQQSAPELLTPFEQPKPSAPTGERAPEEGLTAAAASGFKGAVGSIASGVGAETQELAKQPWMPEFVGEAGQQVGQWLQESGAELKAKAEKYHRPKDMSKFEEYVAYPIMETAGQIGAYAIPYTLPAVGMLAGTASLYGSSMDQLKERAQKENKEWNLEDARPYALLDTAVNALGMRTLGPLKNMLGKEAVLGSRAAIKEIAEKEGLDAAKKYVGSRLGNVAKQLGITEAAFVSGEVAEQAIERAYADLPLFDEEALSEYGAVAKQMAPLGFVSGVAKGVGARHVKAEAVAHLEEQQAMKAAVAQQELEAQQREELANTQVREVAEKKAAKMEELPPELRDMPYKEAKVFQRMLAEREAEVPSAEVTPPVSETTPPVSETTPPVSEVTGPVTEPTAPAKPVSDITPAPTAAPAQEVPYYDTLGLKNLKRNNAYKALKEFDINNPAHAAPINTILDEIEKRGMPRDQAAINAVRAKTEEVKLNAQQIPQAGPLRSNVSQQPREGEEIGYAPESRQGVVEEGREERPTIQGYEVQTPEAKASEVTKEARIVSPDRGIKPIDVPSYADTQNARELAQRVKSLGTDPELKAIADTIMLSPHLGNVAVKWAKAEDVLPEGVRERFNTGTKAIVDWPAKDVQPTIYFDTTSPYLQEDTAVHELVHTVTEAGLRRNPPVVGELEGLSKTVSNALRERAGFAHGSKDMEIADFWDRAVKGDAGELLAYGLTSPTFRQTLEQFGADGKPFQAYRTEEELNALRKGKVKPEKVFTAQPPKALTLWDKFVDAASRLFGLPTKRRDAFKRQLNEYINKKAEHEQRVKDYGTLTPLHEKLDAAFKELLRDTSKKGVAVTEAEAKAAESTPVEKAPKKTSGLVGKMQDKTLGEKMGELGRDLFTEGRSTSFATEGIDARAGLRKGVQTLGSMVDKKLRADLLYSAFEQRGNVIQEAYHNGYAALGSDGSVQAIDNAQLAPLKIFQRVGKKDIEDFGHVLVAMRGKSIRADDRRIKAQADEFLNKADMLEDAAARTKDVKKAKSYNKSAAKLRDLAGKKLRSINYEKGRTHVTEEDIAEAEAIIAKKPHLQREAESVYELLRKQVDLMEKSELIDAETADRFRNYENYFPLYKTEEYDEMMIDPSKYVENIVSQMGRGLKSLPNIKAQKHHAHQIFVEKNLLRHIAFMTSAAAQHSTQKNTIMQLELTGGAERMPKGYKPSKNDHTVLIKEKGRPVFYKVADPDVYYAMQSAQPLMSPLLRRLKSMTNFARGVMVVNPLFWFRQLIREPLQASMVGKVGMVTPFDTIAAIGKITSGKSEGYKKLRSKGVIGPVDVIKDPIEFAKVAFGDKNFVVKRWEQVKHIHEVVDAGTRVAVYDKAKADGLSKGMDEETASDYATMRARELINFSKQGRSQAIRSLRATTPFFGAALNSMDVMARAAFPKTLGKLSKAEVMEAQRNFYNNAATLALYTTAYTMLMSDDEDYLNSSSKRGFWLVPRDDKETPFYKIAVNFESGWFTKELPELLTLYNMGLISKKEAVTEGAKGFKELVLPPMPTIFAIEPMVEVAIDHDFYTGNAIDSGKDAHEMARFRDRKTSELSKAIIGKMEDMGVNAANLSPNQLEHLFRSYFGQLWAVTRAATDAYLYEGPPKVETKLSQLPLVSGVVAGAERDKAVNQFMDVYNNAAEVERSFSTSKKMEDVDKFKTIVQSDEYKKSIKAQRALEDTYKRMGEVKGQMETLDNLDIASDVKTKRMRALEEKYRLLARDGVRKAKLLGIEM